jgi:hypothetical protein
LVKKTKMKIQNKYIFRTIISEFLYFQKKKKINGYDMLLGLGNWIKNKIQKY